MSVKTLTIAAVTGALGIFLHASVSAQGTAQGSIEFEAGPVWQSRNEVRIPNDENGTRFSLVDVVGRGPWPSGRLYATWNINEKHGLRALIAPLSYSEMGKLEESTDFAGQTFVPGEPVEATYQFNSYRLTYRYRIHASDRWRLWVGGTAKVRDAEIRLRQGDTVGRDSNVGFVPLFHFGAEHTLAERWVLLLDIDALAGGPGRAEDLALKLAYRINERWSATAGYRTVEGGAKTDEVYNFAWFHAAVFSAVLSF